MTTGASIEMVWTKGALHPVSPFWARRAQAEFVEGEIYRMADQPERSHNSHCHYFAALNEAWKNLPDAMAERFPTVEHLRKYALIKAGYCNSTPIACSNNRLALDIASLARSLEPFALVDVSDALVTVYTARSQSKRAMPKGEFQRSKDDVLGVVSQMIGVARQALEQAGKAA